MKLLKLLETKKDGKVYHRWTITLPHETVEKLGWEKGDDLDHSIVGNRLTVKKMNA